MRKKVTSIALLVLVASKIIGSIPNYVYADSQFDSLIRIATQARDQLRIYLSKVDTSQEIKEKFELGSAEIESLIKASKDENIPAAREHFLSAMKIFNEIIQQISERTSTSETALSASQPAEAEEVGVSQETLAKLVEIKEHLNSASDSSDVEQIINELRYLISVKQDFEDTKIERLKSRANQLESKIVQLSNYPYEIPELGKAKDMFSDLTILISEGSFNEAVRVLNSLNDLINEIEYSISQRDEEITANEEDSSSSLDDSKTERIKIKIQRLETAINKLAEEVGKNAAAKRWLDNALSLLENARKHVDDSPDESLKIITSIEQIIKRIQNTIQ